MAKNIFFIDTCILLEILQVPQKFNIKDSETHTELLKERSTDKNSLREPLKTPVEHLERQIYL